MKGPSCQSIEPGWARGFLANVWPRALPADSEVQRRKKLAVRAGHLAMVVMIGVAVGLCIQDNEDRLPVCAQLPSLNSTSPPIASVLAPYLHAKEIWKCRSDRTYFQKEQTSYEWNQFLNGASYDRPQDWSPVTQALVETIFGGRLTTPLVGDAAAFHGARGNYTGKNALFFDGRVDKGKL